MRAVVLALFLVGCSRREPTPTPTAAATGPSVVVLPSAAPAPTTSTKTVSGALFAKSMLSECIDISLEVPSGTDPGKAISAMTTDWKKQGIAGIEAPCAETFASKTALAWCDVTKEQKYDAGVAKWTIHSEQFLFENVGVSDTAMKDCIELGGKWNTVGPKSREWRRAELEHLQRLGQKIASGSAAEP